MGNNGKGPDEVGYYTALDMFIKKHGLSVFDADEVKAIVGKARADGVDEGYNDGRADCDED